MGSGASDDINSIYKIWVFFENDHALIYELVWYEKVEVLSSFDVTKKDRKLAQSHSLSICLPKVPVSSL